MTVVPAPRAVAVTLAPEPDTETIEGESDVQETSGLVMGPSLLSTFAANSCVPPSSSVGFSGSTCNADGHRFPSHAFGPEAPSEHDRTEAVIRVATAINYVRGGGTGRASGGRSTVESSFTRSDSEPIFEGARMRKAFRFRQRHFVSGFLVLE
jgi:hypothetical protein